MCVCVCVGRRCANESFGVTLRLKVYRFNSQEDSLAGVHVCARACLQVAVWRPRLRRASLSDVFHLIN